MNDNFWYSDHQPSGRICYGTLGPEHADHPGVHRFSTTDGHVFPDAHLLFPDADTEGAGEFTKPRAGSPCVGVVTSGGSQVFIIGYPLTASFDELSEEPPEIELPPELDSGGDKVYRTSGGAVLTLRRGGAIYLEGGSGTAIILNPVNNQMSFRATNFRQNADGYITRRGRKLPGSTEPETIHEEEFLHQVGPSHDRFRIRHGDLKNDARRELSLASVVVAAGRETATIKTRETYYDDGSWIGEGPRYQWGGEDADEPIVLGNALIALIKELIRIIKGIRVPTAWGPSGVPLPPTPIDLMAVERDIDEIVSDYMFATKEPPELD